MNEASQLPPCGRVRARSSALLDGALSALEEARDRGHLEACDACRGELALEQGLLRAIRDVARRSVATDTPALIGAVMARTRALPRPRRAVGGVPLGLVAAAAGILVCFALFGASSEATDPALQVAALEHVLEQVPSWPEVLRGLGRLSRLFS